MLRFVPYMTLLATILACASPAIEAPIEGPGASLDVVHCFLQAGRQALGLLSDSSLASSQEEVRVWLLESAGAPHYFLRIVKDGEHLSGEATELNMSYSTSDSPTKKMGNALDSAVWCEVLGTNIGYKPRTLGGSDFEWGRMFVDALKVAKYQGSPESVAAVYDEPIIIVESLDAEGRRASTFLETRPDRSPEDRLVADLRMTILKSFRVL